MNKKILAIGAILLFFGMMLLPTSFAIEKKAKISEEIEPLDRGIIYTGIITKNTWEEEGYEGFTFVKPIIVTDGYSLFTFINCKGIGIPDDDLEIYASIILRTPEIIGGGIILR